MTMIIQTTNLPAAKIVSCNTQYYKRCRYLSHAATIFNFIWFLLLGKAFPYMPFENRFWSLWCVWIKYTANRTHFWWNWMANLNFSGHFTLGKGHLKVSWLWKSLWALKILLTSYTATLLVCSKISCFCDLLLLLKKWKQIMSSVLHK